MAIAKIPAHRDAKAIEPEASWRPPCRAQDNRRLKNYEMHSKSELPRYLPLLGFHEDDALSKEAALARVGPITGDWTSVASPIQDNLPTVTAV